MNTQLSLDFGPERTWLLQTRKIVADVVRQGARHPNVQATVVGATGAILARTLALVSHVEGLTPYHTAILFETVFPAVLVLIQQKMSGVSWPRSVRAAVVASAVGFLATASTGIVSH